MIATRLMKIPVDGDTRLQYSIPEIARRIVRKIHNKGKMPRTSSSTTPDLQKAPFQLDFIKPYSTDRPDGTSSSIPYVVDGLLSQGGFSSLVGKPKNGKSSGARGTAVKVTQGRPFLGRNTIRGEVILISLEDPLQHIDNCLRALGYDPTQDEAIHIVTRVAATIPETLTALRQSLEQHPKVRLVIIDPLPKAIRVADLSDYMPVLTATEQLRNVARDFPHIHIMALVHAKKTSTADPFDAILGSTALRGETDTNLIIYECDGRKVIASETRIGRALLPTILESTVIERNGAHVVSEFHLGAALADVQASNAERTSARQTGRYARDILDYLLACEDRSALQNDVLASVTGKRASVLTAIKHLINEGVLAVTEEKPRRLAIQLEAGLLKLYRLGK